MAAPASDSDSDSASERLSRLLKEAEAAAVEMECGDITSSQEELLAGAPFLGSMGARAFFAAERSSRLRKAVEMDCGDITSSQEELLARAPFLGGGGEEEEEEAEVFSTPPLTHDHQGEGEGGGGGDKEGDAIAMCSLPFTQTQTQPSPSPSPPDEVVRPPRMPRVCIRKVRGAKIRTPTPSPDGRRGGGVGGTGSSGGGGIDPLYRAVLMIPTPPARHTAAEDILELARQRGIF